MKGVLITLNGIIIGQRNVGESSRYLDILTEEFGVIEATAHAIKKINSKNAGSTSLFTYAKFCLNKNNKNRYSINSAEPIYSFHKLSADFTAFSLAAYFAELIKYTSATEQKSDGLLRFFAISLYELEKKDASFSLIKSAFELRLSMILGLSPDLIACAECFCYEHAEIFFAAGEGKLFCGDCFYDTNFINQNTFILTPSLLQAMRFIVFSRVEKIYKFELGEKNLRELGFITEEYLLYHLGKKFRTLEYYKKIFM